MGLVTISGDLTHVIPSTLKPPVIFFSQFLPSSASKPWKKKHKFLFQWDAYKPNHLSWMVIPLQVKTFYIFFLLDSLNLLGVLVPAWQLQTTNAAPGLHWMERKFCRFQVLPSPLGSSSGWKSPFPYMTSVWKLSVNTFVLPIRWIVCYIPTFTIENTKCRYITIHWSYEIILLKRHRPYETKSTEKKSEMTIQM